MLRINSIPSLAALVVASQLSTGTAAAHIWLEEPISRYPSEVAGENKACPCGVGQSNRSCRVEGDRSDPNRSTDRVTTLVAGSMVTFRFDEYVPHSGRYRVAFDENGADLEDFNAHILVDIPDPVRINGLVGNIGEGSIWEIEVPVPNTPCTNCTLQLIQMMDGNMVDLVPDPVGRSSYYQCADIVIVPADGETSGGQGGSAGGGAGVLATPDAGATSGSTSAGADVPDDATPDDSGCSIGRLEATSGWQVLGALSVLVLAQWGRRRPAATQR